MTRLKFSLVGLILLFLLAALFAGVHWYIVQPALDKLPNGTYGEMYGPVRALRWPFYLFIFAVALLVFRLFFWVRKGKE